MTSVQSLIDGSWVDAAAGGKSVSRNSPFSAETVFTISDLSPEQLDAAVSAAARAQQEWCAMSPVARSEALWRAGACLAAVAEKLAPVIVSEVGKTAPEAIGEIGNAARVLQFHAGSVLREQGSVVLSARPNTQATVEWEPLGVVGAITPWNFPINIPTIKIAAALAASNAIVIKPSSEAAASTAGLVRAIAACFPSGLIGLVAGSGAVGRALVEHPGIDAVTFTGSTTVGREVAAVGAARGIPFQCEMGGRNSITISDTADLDSAVPAAANSAFLMAGQKCTAASDLMVHASVYDEVVSRLRAELRQGRFEPGDPREPETTVGSLISERAKDEIEQIVDAAIAEGASLLWPETGVTAPSEPEGAFLSPLVLGDVGRDSRFAHEEVFGPVLTVTRVGSVTEAIERTNATGYGLVSSIYTSSLADAMEFSKRVRVGTVLVNQPTTGLDYHIQFGGWGRSGQGPTEQSDTALRAFMRPKARYVSWPASHSESRA